MKQRQREEVGGRKGGGEGGEGGRGGKGKRRNGNLILVLTCLY